MPRQALQSIQQDLQSFLINLIVWRTGMTTLKNTRTKVWNDMVPRVESLVYQDLMTYPYSDGLIQKFPDEGARIIEINRILAERKQANRYCYIGFEEADVGYMCLSQDTSNGVRYAEVLGFYLHPEYRGQRLGQTLLSQALQTARAKRLSVLCAWVNADNTGAQWAYRNRGFVADPNIYPAKPDCQYWEIRL